MCDSGLTRFLLKHAKQNMLLKITISIYKCVHPRKHAQQIPLLRQVPMSRSLVQRSVAADCHDVDLGAQDRCRRFMALPAPRPSRCSPKEPRHGENGAGVGILAGGAQGGDVEQIHRRYMKLYITKNT